MASGSLKAQLKGGRATGSLKVAMVAADSLLISLAPVLVQLSKDRAGQYAYNPVTVNFLVELVKTLFSYGILVLLGLQNPANDPAAAGKPVLTRSVRMFVRDAVHCRVLVVPAALYAVNNYLKFIMQLFFNPTATRMLSNLKIFVIAVLMRAILHRRFSLLQWQALFLLVAGITVNQLSNCDSKDAAGFSVNAGLVTLVSVTVPSMASVYNEYGFKKDMDTSVHIQNFYLYFYGLIMNAVALGAWAVVNRGRVGELFNGMNVWVVLLIVNNASQGLLASFFYKFADTILKKYSSTIATIFTGVISALVLEHGMTVNFMLGVTIVFISMHQFFAEKDRQQTGLKVQMSPSMEHFREYQETSATSSATGQSALLPR